jgi:hypothetical protein
LAVPQLRSKLFRELAEKSRILAETFKNQEYREQMSRIAADYARMATIAEGLEAEGLEAVGWQSA